MGIPSYFSYIIKNHKPIIKKFNKEIQTHKINNLYIDGNSIIYDAVTTVCITISDKIDEKIINQVILKIEEYIGIISPDNYILIAFDGVAPIAKLDQQRSRRYKSLHQNTISQTIFKKKIANDWNTTAITPGTIFMSTLNEMINAHFNDVNVLGKLNANKVIVSSSNECGEGEHKIFDFIRKNATEHLNASSVVYGLDADLIMLAINHLHVSPKIYLFRETPEFIKSIDSSLEPNETYLLDIPEFAETLSNTMNKNNNMDDTEMPSHHDYIFMCFFLGNDFMPHFPSMNIRTGGIDKLLNAYKETMNKNEYLTDGQTIFWKHVRKLVRFLVTHEEDFLKQEMKLRDKREKFTYYENTPEQRYTRFEAIPNYRRDLEKYIDPFQPDWEKRYYAALFNMDASVEYEDYEPEIKKICFNYIEGLEWTLKYYTTGCPNWKWKYNYHYPPLLKDLLCYIPYFETEFIKREAENPVSSLVQLAYVIPRKSLYLLPEPLHKKLSTEYEEWYPQEDVEYIWCFCKYFWESHVCLPDIDVDELTKVVNSVMGKVN